MAGHTPGPWAIITHEGVPHVCTDKGAWPIADIRAHEPSDPDDDDVMANALLIAAAPEMLATLEMIEEARDRGAAILGIFHDVEARERVCNREVDVSVFTPLAA